MKTRKPRQRRNADLAEAVAVPAVPPLPLPLPPLPPEPALPLPAEPEYNPSQQTCQSSRLEAMFQRDRSGGTEGPFALLGRQRTEQELALAGLVLLGLASEAK